MAHVFAAALAFTLVTQAVAIREDEFGPTDSLQVLVKAPGSLLAEGAGRAAGRASSGWGWDDVSGPFGPYWNLVKERGSLHGSTAFLVEAKKTMTNTGLREPFQVRPDDEHRVSSAPLFKTEQNKHYVLKVFDHPTEDTYLNLHQQAFGSAERTQRRVRNANIRAGTQCQLARRLLYNAERNNWAHTFPQCLFNGVQPLKGDHTDQPNQVDYIITEELLPSGINWPDFVMMFQRNHEDISRILRRVFVMIMEQGLQGLAGLEEQKFIHHDVRYDTVSLQMYMEENTTTWSPELKFRDVGFALRADKLIDLYNDVATESPTPSECGKEETDQRESRQNNPKTKKKVFNFDYPYGYDLYLLGALLMHYLAGEEWHHIVALGLWQCAQDLEVQQQQTTKRELQHKLVSGLKEGVPLQVSIGCIPQEAQKEFGKLLDELKMISGKRASAEKDDPTLEKLAKDYDSTSVKLTHLWTSALFMAPYSTTSWLPGEKIREVVEQQIRFAQNNNGITTYSEMVWNRMDSAFKDKVLPLVGRMLAFNPSARGKPKELLNSEDFKELKRRFVESS